MFLALFRFLEYRNQVLSSKIEVNKIQLVLSIRLKSDIFFSNPKSDIEKIEIWESKNMIFSSRFIFNSSIDAVPTFPESER